MKRKPRVAVFYGGAADTQDLSRTTGEWVCEHLPRSQYEVIPVHVTGDERWQVPLGSLPASGHVNRVMEMLTNAVPMLPRARALPRLLDREPDVLLTLVRGKGGDDGSIQNLADMVDVAAVGPSPSICITTADKQACARALEAIALSPLAVPVSLGVPAQAAAQAIREQISGPVFVKPRQAEGSSGVRRVEDGDDLAAVLAGLGQQGDVLVQEAPAGIELSVTVYEDDGGKIHVLPPTIVHPIKAKFFDSLAKRREGRVKLVEGSPADPTLSRAMETARAIYQHLALQGVAQIDMIAHHNEVDILEVNTVPTATPHTPLIHQLGAAGVSAAHFVDGLVRRALKL